MAGLRLGYAVGQPDDRAGDFAGVEPGQHEHADRGRRHRVAAETPQHMEEERKENARVRDFTLQAFKRPGLRGHRLAHQLHLREPEAAGQGVPRRLRAKVRVGRDFPPFEKTHSRISLGTMDEMRQAVEVFSRVLTTSTRTVAR